MARTKTFSDTTIASLKPTAHRQEIRIPQTRALYIVIQPSGSKVFACRFRLNGMNRKLTLGNWIADPQDDHDAKIGEAMGLASAIKLAGDAMLAVSRGKDPCAQKRRAKRDAHLTAADTFESVAARHYKIEGSKLKTGAGRYADLVRLVSPTFGKRPMADIERSDILHLLEDIQDENGRAMADRIWGIMRVVFKFHAIRNDRFRSPIVEGMRPTTYQPRARILDDRELRAVWKASATPTPFHSLIRYLLLTSSRRSEASAMVWDELKDGIWFLPASRNKTGEELARPLAPAALAVLDGLPKIDGNPFVFAAGGRVMPFTGFGRAKRNFDKAVLVELRKADPDAQLPAFTLHDLRRSSRSLMSRAKVPTDHAERVLGHAIGGIRGIYDRFEYLDEKRDALERLAAMIASIVDPQPDNVVRLRA
jgi:integrase